MIIYDTFVNLTIDNEDYEATVNYTVTSWGAPETGPSFSSGGEPAEPPEWEIKSITVNINNNDVELNYDNLSKKDQENIDNAVYEDLANIEPEPYDPYDD